MLAITVTRRTLADPGPPRLGVPPPPPPAPRRTHRSRARRPLGRPAQGGGRDSGAAVDSAAAPRVRVVGDRAVRSPDLAGGARRVIRAADRTGALWHAGRDGARACTAGFPLVSRVPALPSQRLRHAAVRGEHRRRTRLRAEEPAPVLPPRRGIADIHPERREGEVAAAAAPAA